MSLRKDRGDQANPRFANQFQKDQMHGLQRAKLFGLYAGIRSTAEISRITTELMSVLGGTALEGPAVAVALSHREVMGNCANPEKIDNSFVNGLSDKLQIELRGWAGPIENVTFSRLLVTDHPYAISLEERRVRPQPLIVAAEIAGDHNAHKLGAARRGARWLNVQRQESRDNLTLPSVKGAYVPLLTLDPSTHDTARKQLREIGPSAAQSLGAISTNPIVLSESTNMAKIHELSAAAMLEHEGNQG